MIYETSGKHQKQFKGVFQMFFDFSKFSENHQNSSEVFGNIWKTLETVQK